MPTRKEELEKRIDSLLEEFSDVSIEDVADVFDYYAGVYQFKANEENK